MSETTARRISANPAYRKLVKDRDALAWLLTACVMLLYFGFILLVAFAPGVLTRPISGDSVIPLGIPIGIAVILAAVVLTAIYVRRANSHFDPLIDAVVKDALK